MCIFLVSTFNLLGFLSEKPCCMQVNFKAVWWINNENAVWWNNNDYNDKIKQKSTFHPPSVLSFESNILSIANQLDTREWSKKSTKNQQFAGGCPHCPVCLEISSSKAPSVLHRDPPKWTTIKTYILTIFDWRRDVPGINAKSTILPTATDPQLCPEHSRRWQFHISSRNLALSVPDHSGIVCTFTFGLPQLYTNSHYVQLQWLLPSDPNLSYMAVVNVSSTVSLNCCLCLL